MTTAKLKKLQKDFVSPLKIPEGKIGEWEIKHVKRPAGYKFELANFRARLMGGQTNETITWPHETVWHYLLENGQVWMADVPCEHKQMKTAIRGMRGHVLVGGLGLGLALALLKNNRNVTYITVVEKEQDVIDLVAKHIPNPWGSHKWGRRYNVVCADLFDYLKKAKAEIDNKTNFRKPFDNAFYDIWTSDGERTFFETVCPLYDLSRGVVKKPPRNWNEDVMRGQLQHSIQQRLMFMTNPELSKFVQGTETPEYDKPKGTIFWDWTVPFFEWLKNADPKPLDEKLTNAAVFYACNYGTWRWRARWDAHLAVGAFSALV